ncbi:hypothetical protein ACQKE0_01580 [Shewanella colwelliana]|uniref:hypothetical protein n=1 Tax=Shewanella colwelliana TaxID=23 RepID=UPI003D06F497
MPNFATKAKAKLERGWRKLAAPCQFIPASGEPFYRGVNVIATQTDASNEYLPQPIALAEFLKADGAVNVDDEFALNGTTYLLTQLHSFDEISHTFVYIAN